MRAEEMHVPKVRVAGRWYPDAVAYATVSIARGLRRLRDRAGLTQAEVAHRAGIRPETLSRVENGRANPTVATVRKIVRAIARADRRSARPRAGRGGMRR
jgi:DNA-binding XRE family transcriptional regulator